MFEFLLLTPPMVGWPLPNIVNILATLLFTLECYHFIGHVCVLFRVRLLPRRDLVKIRYYFLFDTLTVFTVCFLYTGKLRWLAALQMMQHLFFFFTWNEQSFTNKVISWSSLDWTKQDSTKSRWEWTIILGTLFDVVVHAINAFVLVQYMSTAEVFVGLLLAQAIALLIMFSPRLAWANPASSSSLPSGGGLDAGKREQLMNQVKAQIAVANAQELLQQMSDKCFKKCVTKPGSSLDSSEQKCIGMCMDRYMDAFNLVSRAYTSRLQKERMS